MRKYFMKLYSALSRPKWGEPSKGSTELHPVQSDGCTDSPSTPDERLNNDLEPEVPAEDYFLRNRGEPAKGAFSPTKSSKFVDEGDWKLDDLVSEVAGSTAAVPHEKLPTRMQDINAREAAEFLKALGHDGRLLILCHLSHGKKSVAEMEALLGARQAAVSQQLSRLRLEGLVKSHREGRSIIYSIDDPRILRIISLIHELFCVQER